MRAERSCIALTRKIERYNRETYHTRLTLVLCVLARSWSGKRAQPRGSSPGSSRRRSDLPELRRRSTRQGAPVSRSASAAGGVPPQRPAAGIYGYATDDIFYLEVCDCSIKEITQNKEITKRSTYLESDLISLL